MPYSYQHATENEILCPHCRSVPFLSNPHTGGDFCEGARCPEAWVKYLESELGNPCETCNNRGMETMDRVAACNCCDDYEYYSPVDGWEENNE